MHLKRSIWDSMMGIKTITFLHNWITLQLLNKSVSGDIPLIILRSSRFTFSYLIEHINKVLWKSQFLAYIIHVLLN